MLRIRLVSMVAVAMVSGAVALPNCASAQRAATPFCRTFKVISHDPRTDRTGMPSDTFARVKHIEERYSRALFHHCLGVVSVGLETVTSAGPPKHNWVIGISVLTRDMPSSNEPSFIDGVRLVLRAISSRPTTGPLYRRHKHR